MVESSGCSTAALDQDPGFRSVAARLMRNGAVAFAGNSRRGIAQQELFRTELWNGLDAGLTLGQANRRAANRVVAAVLERGETDRGPYHYQLHNAAVFGDPALAPALPPAPAAGAPRIEVEGARVLVHGPARWRRHAAAPLAEWGCAFPILTSWRAPGVGVESRWHDGEKRDEEDLLVTVEVRTRLPVTGIEPLDPPPPPLGWTGRAFLDEHPDGKRSVLWRVRFLDADMTTGEVRAQVGRLAFRLRRDE
ncbi:MAG: C25 family cysteine peptidase [Planctomycetota bacterium]